LKSLKGRNQSGHLRIDEKIILNGSYVNGFGVWIGFIRLRIGAREVLTSTPYKLSGSIKD
jgi:hypothetical protein